MPIMISSDKGAIFIGAEKELRECIENRNAFNTALILRIKALGVGSILLVRNAKLTSGRGWPVVLREYFIRSLVRLASQMRF